MLRPHRHGSGTPEPLGRARAARARRRRAGSRAGTRDPRRSLRREREEKSKELDAARAAGVERVLLDARERPAVRAAAQSGGRDLSEDRQHHAGQRLLAGPGVPPAGVFWRATWTSARSPPDRSRGTGCSTPADDAAPRRRPAFADVHAQRYDFPEEDFFGLGADSRREDHVTYGLRNTLVGASGGVRPIPWLSLGGGVDQLTPSIGSRRAVRASSADLFGPDAVPGLAAAARLPALRGRRRPQLPRAARQPAPRRPLRASRTSGSTTATSTATRSARRGRPPAVHPAPQDRRVLALRALASTLGRRRGPGGAVLPAADARRPRRSPRLPALPFPRRQHAAAAGGVPLGDLHRHGRRDLLRRRQGRVATRGPRPRDLESDYGIGFRFGTVNGVFLRVEGAFGSSGGKHFILRFGHVF